MDPASELPERKMPEGYTENDYKFFKSFMYINKVGQDVMCEAAKALYAKELVMSDAAKAFYAKEPGTENGIMSLGEYFIKVLKISKKKLDKFVTKMHRKYLVGDIQSVTFDIPFAHVVVMKNACPDLFPMLSEPCKDSIERLNKLRDKTCHVYGYLVDIEEVEDIFEKIYVGVGEVIGENFTDSVKIAKERLRNIFSSQVCQIDIDSYFEDVRNFREALRCQLIEKGRIEIQDCCSQLHIHSPFTAWLQNQDGRTDIKSAKFDIFSSLQVRDNGEVDLERLFKVTKRLGNKEDLPCALLLHGDAGYGKTTLCHYIIEEWCREDSSIDGLHDFELVVFVEVRRVLTKRIEDFLKETVFRDTLKDFKSGTVLTTLQNINVLFIIDGFDEARRDSSLPLVNEIFSKFKQKRILLTTRNSHIKDAVYIARNFKASSLSIEVYGFDTERQNLFITEMIKAFNPNNVDYQKEMLELKEYVNCFRKTMDCHLKVPIILCLIIYLWRENPMFFSKNLSVAHLYSELSLFCKKKLKDTLDLEKMDNIDSMLDELQLCLGQQAWNMLVKGNLVCLTEEAHKKLTEECNKRMIDETKLLSAYLCHETSHGKMPCTEKPIYAFLHKLQMEYFGAMYLADAVTKGNCSLQDIDKFVCKTSDWCRHQEVVKIFGECLFQSDSLKVTNDKILKEFVLILEKSDIPNTDFTFWWNIYLIAHKFKEIKHLISSVLPKNHWHLDANHVVAGLELYLDLRMNLETLIIEIPADVEPFSIKDFLSVMKKIKEERAKEKKSQSRSKFSPVMVALHFWHHYEHGSFSTSEEFLQLLHPWGYLTSFAGKLGQKEVLKYSLKLRTIRVRLESVNDVLSFKSSISKYYKNVKSLTVMLCLPFNCPLDRLCDIRYVSELEIVMKGIGDEQIEWLEEVLQHIVGNNRCQQLTLLDSALSYHGISSLQLSLKKIVKEMTIKLKETPAEMVKSQLEELQSEGSLKITWTD